MSAYAFEREEWRDADRHDKTEYRVVGGTYYDVDDLPDRADVED